MSAENPDFSQPMEDTPEVTQTELSEPTSPQEDLASPEKTEHIPTEEEVRGVFQELIAGPYTESRKLEDEKGLYLLDVTVPGQEDGEIIEYSYMRAGRYPEGQASNTRIDKTIYQDEMPVGGEGVAELIDGEWKIFD